MHDYDTMGQTGMCLQKPLISLPRMLFNGAPHKSPPPPAPARQPTAAAAPITASFLTVADTAETSRALQSPGQRRKAASKGRSMGKDCFPPLQQGEGVAERKPLLTKIYSSATSWHKPFSLLRNARNSLCTPAGISECNYPNPSQFTYSCCMTLTPVQSSSIKADKPDPHGTAGHLHHAVHRPTHR